jgi:hypothetical protein
MEYMKKIQKGQLIVLYIPKFHVLVQEKKSRIQ